jgi:NAD(P)H dehydrogenase (quinone)
MSKFQNAVLGVTGASGQLGRQTIESLLERGATRVVAITRDPAKLADLTARGVEIRKGSFDDAASLAIAFKGIERLLIISTDDLTVEGDCAAQHIRAIDVAEQSGVRHILYTSLTSPYPDPAALIPNDHFWTEARLAAGNTDWSVLRNNMYADAVLQGAKYAIASGKLFHAAGTGGRAYVTRADCAAAAAGALLSAEGKAIYDIGGPEAVTQAQVAALLSSVSGKPVAAESVSAEALKGGMASAGVPPIFVDVMARFDTDTAQGYLGIVSNAVARLTGRQPQSLADFLATSKTLLTA